MRGVKPSGSGKLMISRKHSEDRRCRDFSGFGCSNILGFGSRDISGFGDSRLLNTWCISVQVYEKHGVGARSCVNVRLRECMTAYVATLV